MFHYISWDLTKPFANHEEMSEPELPSVRDMIRLIHSSE